MVFVVVDVALVGHALEEPLVPVVPPGLVDHLVVNVAVVFPMVRDPVIVTGGVTVIGGVTVGGFEHVAVFDELWVLAVPPLIVG